MPAHPRRKAFGQHFLRDKALCERLTDLCLQKLQENSCKSLLEVGPGSGALTEPMIRKLVEAPHVVFSVAEMDRKWASHWKGVVRVWDSDFLEVPEGEWLAFPPLGVISNLPYASGTAILLRLAERPDRIPFMILMFQAEVAHRLRAEAGSKAWGSLSLWIQNLWDVSKVASVPPGAFQPPPEVDSEVVLLVPRKAPRLSSMPKGNADATQLWNSLLRASFAHRRKMLRAGLSGHPEFRDALAPAGIDPTLRAEALSWDQWNSLFKTVWEKRSSLRG
ncbi:ribosomal RNA small subunit methyltransferase A [bacterium]|nr:ribosomal RNA small subunit methyltransferase A [bacterium]